MVLICKQKSPDHRSLQVAQNNQTFLSMQFELLLKTILKLWVYFKVEWFVFMFVLLQAFWMSNGQILTWQP